MCAECPVEANERLIRRFVEGLNKRLRQCGDHESRDRLSIMTVEVALALGININPSKPDIRPVTINPECFNAKLCFVLGPEGYTEANG